MSLMLVFATKKRKRFKLPPKETVPCAIRKQFLSIITIDSCEQNAIKIKKSPICNAKLHRTKEKETHFGIFLQVHTQKLRHCVQNEYGFLSFLLFSLSRHMQSRIRENGRGLDFGLAITIMKICRDKPSKRRRLIYSRNSKKCRKVFICVTDTRIQSFPCLFRAFALSDFSLIFHSQTEDFLPRYT